VLEKVGAQINALIDKLRWKIRNNLPSRLTYTVMGYESPPKDLCTSCTGKESAQSQKGLLTMGFLLHSEVELHANFHTCAAHHIHSTPANKCIGWWRNKEAVTGGK
jgi:hypothetical protein